MRVMERMTGREAVIGNDGCGLRVAVSIHALL
jgi:hypothetical protein